MLIYLQIKNLSPNFKKIAIFKNRLGKICLYDYLGKRHVILFFYSVDSMFLPMEKLDELNVKLKNLSIQLLVVPKYTSFSDLKFLLLMRPYIKTSMFEIPYILDTKQTIAKKYSILQNLNSYIILIDKDGTIQYYNEYNIFRDKNIDEVIQILKSFCSVKEKFNKYFSKTNKKKIKKLKKINRRKRLRRSHFEPNYNYTIRYKYKYIRFRSKFYP